MAKDLKAVRWDLQNSVEQASNWDEGIRIRFCQNFVCEPANWKKRAKNIPAQPAYSYRRDIRKVLAKRLGRVNLGKSYSLGKTTLAASQSSESDQRVQTG